MDLIKRWADECRDLVLEEKGEEVERFVVGKLKDEFEVFVEYLTNLLNDVDNSGDALCNWFVCRGGTSERPVDADFVREILLKDLARSEPVIVDYLIDVIAEEVIFGNDEPWRKPGER